MNDALLLDVVTNSVKTLTFVLAPLLLALLLVGLVVSVFQAVTQVNEQTLVFVPKLLIAFIVMVVAGPWMAEQLTQFTIQLFNLLPQMAR